MPFERLADHVAEVRDRIAAAVSRGGRGQRVEIVAVTKTHGPEAAQAAWDAGLHQVGENRVQEALAKMDRAPASLQWHLIGHLQRNKVKHLERFALFHALDSVRLAETIDEFSRSSGVRYPVLVQVNTSGEGTKGGFSLDDLRERATWLRSLPGIVVRGVMTMAPFDADEVTLRATFGGCRAAVKVLRDTGHDASELSMGMSNDYEVAVEEGATVVRLGTILFGARTP
jgi:pyridoxal phosphate enzyme (YggS family)